MSRETIVIGAGGHAKVVVSTLFAAARRVVGLFDDDPAKKGHHVLGIPVVGDLDGVPHDTPALIGIGKESVRKQVAERLDLDWATVVHPAAILDPSATLGPGTVVFAGAVVQPDVRVGRHVIINTSASVDHDCRLEDFSQIGPGAHLAGSVQVGEGAFVGTGASVCPGIRIGAWSIVAAGAAVTKDVPDGTMVAGVPARVVKEIPQVQR